jgi:tRNA(Ile)-lysidine synthase
MELTQFSLFIKKHQLADKSKRILLAVSGGADSMVMCDLFLKSGYQIGIAHCNFKLRGDESDHDEQFVQQYAETHQLPYYSKQFDTIAHSKQYHISIEEAARNLRYAFFYEIAQSFQFDLIATAHHGNDNIETVLLNLTKGTGIAGLKGIPLKNNLVIRPLLFLNKEQILNYCQTHAISFCTDSSNTELIYQRNKIRHTIIPEFTAMNPAFTATMLQNIEQFGAAYQFYKTAISQKLKKIITTQGNDMFIATARLGNDEQAGVLLFELLSPLHFNATQIRQLTEKRFTTGNQFLNEQYRVLVDRKHIIISPIKTITTSIQFIEENTKHIQLEGAQLSFEISNYNQGMTFNDSGNVAYFDASKITYPLTVRKWKAGDYLHPLGLTKRKSAKPGKKKVGDILSDAKTSALVKENTYVLLCGEHIIWLAGFRQDERFKVTPSTSKLLKIKMLSN